MSETLLDVSFSWAGINSAAVKSVGASGVLVYCGPARPSVPWLHEMVDNGVAVIFIFESSTTRAFAGYDAGVADAKYTLSRVREVGYPDECGIAVCAADTPNVSGYEGQIAAYFQGWESVTGPRIKISYGSIVANNAAASGGAEGPWGVGTWGYGEASWANARPSDPRGAWLIQSGNTPGPLPDTDLNWLYVPLSQLQPWGGSTAAPTPKENSNMLVGLRKRPDGAYDASIIDGGIAIHAFTGPMAVWGYVTAPADAQQFSVDTGTHPFGFNDLEWVVIDARTKASVVMPSTGGGGGGGGTGVPAPPAKDPEVVAQAVIDAVGAGPVDDIDKIIHNTIVEQLK